MQGIESVTYFHRFTEFFFGERLPTIDLPQDALANEKHVLSLYVHHIPF